MNKYCSKVKGPLKPNTDFEFKKCRGEVSCKTIPNIDPVDINDKAMENVRSFCNLRDFIGQCGGCFNATTARIISACKKFTKL